MKRLDVYPLFDIEPVKGEGCYVIDRNGDRYLDFYGGHAVISIGHGHPHYNQLITDQLNSLPFYSNSIINAPQDKLAKRLGEVSGLNDYELFLLNSGAEANEAALKIASGVTGRKKIISLEKAFHGRTALAVAATDNKSYYTPMNDVSIIERVPINDIEAIKKVMDDNVAAVIIEGIQGISGIYEPTTSYLEALSNLCNQNQSFLILDEIQSGYGRSGDFFAYQISSIQPDLVTMAKGMGNGFPIGGVAVAPGKQPPKGLLGTTFGGNHLACAAGIAVLDVIEKEHLVENARNMGDILLDELNSIDGIKEVRGRGLMIGVEFDYPIKEIRSELLHTHKIFTGNASQPNTLRLLPPLTVGKDEIQQFLNALKSATKK